MRCTHQKMNKAGFIPEKTRNIWLKKEVFFYNPKSIETTPDYWDCECEDQYIHPNSERICDRCSCVREDQPNSRISELYEMHYKLISGKHIRERRVDE